MSGSFELKQSSDGQFRFSLQAADGTTLLRSEGYTEKSSALNGIASVQKNAGLDERYEKKEATNGKRFFNLKAGNHQVIGTSPLHSTEAERDQAIAATKIAGLSQTINEA